MSCTYAPWDFTCTMSCTYAPWVFTCLHMSQMCFTFPAVEPRLSSHREGYRRAFMAYDLAATW